MVAPLGGDEQNAYEERGAADDADERGFKEESMPPSTWAWHTGSSFVVHPVWLRAAGGAGGGGGGACRDCQRGWAEAGHDAAGQCAGDEVADAQGVLHDVGADDGGVDHAAESCKHVDGSG